MNLTREQIEMWKSWFAGRFADSPTIAGQAKELCDMALRAAEPAQPVGYENVPMGPVGVGYIGDKPVAWGIIACNTGKLSSVTLDKSEADEYKPEHRVPLYTRPHDSGLVERLLDMRERWVGIIREQSWGDQLDGDIDLIDEAARALGGER